MNKKLIMSTVMGLLVLGPTMAAAADCPAFLNAEEGVPCVVGKTGEAMAETTTLKIRPAPSRESEQRNANVEAWKVMVQNDK